MANSSENQMCRDALRDRLTAELANRGLISQSANWYPFRGGRTNNLWRVEGAERPLVCKLFSEVGGTLLFPNRPDSEVLALRHLAGSGLAPILAGDLKIDAGRCLIYEYVEGSPWRNDVEQVAQALHRLHQVKPPAGLRKIDGGHHAIREMTTRILDDCQQVPDWLASEPGGGQPRGFAPAQLSFLHGDVVPENIICTDSGVVFIDWQCPAIGDPAEDLFTFLSPAMQILYRGRVLSAEEERTFLLAYPDSSVVERMQALRPFMHRRMAAHCLWKTERGSEDYREAVALERAALEALRQQ